MAEILITGMEMPKYCCHCRFESSSIHGQYCILTKKFTRLNDNEDGSERHISCPLKEVPPHGALCDKDKLKEEAGGTYQWSQVIEAIKNAPVILEATV